MDVAELEELVADNVTPDDEERRGDRRLCRRASTSRSTPARTATSSVGEETADVHFVVTEVEDGEVDGRRLSRRTSRGTGWPRS